ncbi:SDR family NAD(P)-dependent oxidoreductase [Candidatus Korobacter versatilis]|nr:SDR family oxidoreductase [Candidatus Koribacter versatilis]
MCRLNRMSFSGKIIAITGGANGLGAELGRQLKARGATVVLADIKAAPGIVRVDVTDHAAMSEFLRAVAWRYGKIDYVFNNAGILRYEESLGSDLSNWQRVVDVNLMGVVSGSLEAYRLMAKQGSGHIVNIGSMSPLSLFPLFAAYATSKAGVLAFSRMLRLEAESSGVNVTVVCPGSIRTDINADYKPSFFTPMISVEDAARRILRGVERNQGIVVFPFHAKLFWWLDRIHPALLDPLRRIILGRYRARKLEPTPTPKALETLAPSTSTSELEEVVHSEQ